MEADKEKKRKKGREDSWVWFYGTSTVVGYLMLNKFLYI